MYIHPAQPAPIQLCLLDKPKNLIVVRHHHLRQRGKQSQDLCSSTQPSASKLSHHKRMRDDMAVNKHLTQPRIPAPEMVDPDRRVHQNHAALPDRRRGIDLSLFSVPPSSARRRALSRAIKASSPRCMSAVFPLTPVSFAARSKSAASMFSVVLICMNMHRKCRSVKHRGLSRGADNARIKPRREAASA